MIYERGVGETALRQQWRAFAASKILEKVLVELELNAGRRTVIRLGRNRFRTQSGRTCDPCLLWRNLKND